MPIYLPPISRRDFVKRMLVAGAGAELGPALEAAERPVNEHSWALLSDTHLAADRVRMERGVNMARHFETVSRELLGLAERPAGVFINGDCALNSGEKGDYQTVAELLEVVRGGQMPVHLTLGNHDQREHFWDVFPAEKAAARPVADRQMALVRTAAANWFILDSLDKTQSTPGLLGREQLVWLSQALDANASKPAVVMLHHNPGIEGGNFGLKDTLALLEVLRPRKQVKAYIYGHTHHWAVEQDTSGIHFVNLPPVSYVFKAGEPSGWVHAMLASEGMRLELRCVDRSHPAHGQVKELKWRA